MARKAQDPNPEFNQMPEMTIESIDYNMFYKPETKQTSPGLKALASSLANIVPALASYSVTEDIKFSEKEKARAINDYNANNKAFANLVKSGQIPQGASPHYYNKMMELELNNKARDFKKKFDTFYTENSLNQSMTPDAFAETYETQLKEFYTQNGLERYDPLALSRGFFNLTSNFRNEREQQHMAKRMEWIQQNTEKNAIKNYTGLFIEAQNDELDISQVHDLIKNETGEFIKLGTDKFRANELFVAGLQNYIKTVNDEEGIEFARDIVDSLSTLKLGTGYFAGEKGSRRASAIQEELELELDNKELGFLERKKKLFSVREDIRKQNLDEDYFTARGADGFNIFDFSETLQEKDKAYVISLHNTIKQATKTTVSDPFALKDLYELQDTDDFAVREKAFEYLKNGELTIEDYKGFANSAGRNLITKTNKYFLRSLPYQNYTKMFNSPDLVQYGLDKLELPVLRNRFDEEIVLWHEENKNKEQYQNNTSEYQRQFNAQVKVIMGDMLADSIALEDYDEVAPIFMKLGIVIPRRD